MALTNRIVRLDNMRRVTLPADLLQALGAVQGENLMASTNGDGSVILRSLHSHLREIGEEIRMGFGDDGARINAPSLSDDHVVHDRALDRRLTEGSAETDAAAAALLSRLGL